MAISSRTCSLKPPRHRANVAKQNRVRGIAAAAAALPWLRETTKEIVIVIRSAPRGVAPREVGRALGSSGLHVLPEQQQLATRADRGEPVLANDAYAKAVRALLADAMPVKASVA